MSERRYLMGVCPGARETAWAVLLNDQDMDFYELFGAGVLKGGDDSFEKAGYVNRINAKVATEINFAESIDRQFRLGIARAYPPTSFRHAAVCNAISSVCQQFGVYEFRFGPRTVMSKTEFDGAGYLILGNARVWAEPELQEDLSRLWKPTQFAVLAGLSPVDKAVSFSAALRGGPNVI